MSHEWQSLGSRPKENQSLGIYSCQEIMQLKQLNSSYNIEQKTINV